MEKPIDIPTIVESFLEHRQSFTSPWINHWVVPNPFIFPIYDGLKETGVVLTDISFNKEPSNFGEAFLKIALRNLNAEVRVGLDSVIFSAANPDWASASILVSAFEQVTKCVCEIVGARPRFQETMLAIHVLSGRVDLQLASASLVNSAVLGECDFYGLSLYRKAGTITLDKSVRHNDAAFIRIQRRFLGDESFDLIASKLFDDEVFALKLLGLAEGLEGVHE